MNPYQTKSISQKTVLKKTVACFDVGSDNIDQQTVDSFGEEWLKFDEFSEEDIKTAGDQYFDIVNEEMLNQQSLALDLGCGSGRWTKYISNKAAFIEAVDPSKAVFQAAMHYNDLENVRFTQASVDTLPFKDNSFDFVMSLGVLHHIPDTAKALKSAMSKLKPGGYALIYLYYALDNRGGIYRLIFELSALLRNFISKMPGILKQLLCDFLAIIIYLPFIALAKITRRLFGKRLSKKIPLYYYTDKSWNIIRNDALDRFGTPLEQRYSKAEITAMMLNAGMENIQFSDHEPYWHLVAKKAE